MDSPTTVMQMASNCSSLFPYPPILTLQCEYLADISVWTAAHHVKLKISKSVHPRERVPSHGHVYHCRGRHSIAFVDCEEPGPNPLQQTVLRPQHHCCGPILQICNLQHLQDLVFPHKG